MTWLNVKSPTCCCSFVGLFGHFSPLGFKFIIDALLTNRKSFSLKHTAKFDLDLFPGRRYGPPLS